MSFHDCSWFQIRALSRFLPSDHMRLSLSWDLAAICSTLARTGAVAHSASCAAGNSYEFLAHSTRERSAMNSNVSFVVNHTRQVKQEGFDLCSRDTSLQIVVPKGQQANASSMEVSPYLISYWVPLPRYHDNIF